MNRFKAGEPKGFVGERFLVLKKHFAFADHGEGEMGERSKVATGAHRAKLRNIGSNASLDHGEEHLDNGRAATAIAESENVGSQEHHRSSFNFGERRANAGGVAAHQI